MKSRAGGRSVPKQSFLSYAARNPWLYILLAPGFVFMLIFRYAPMYGVVIAFQDFNLVKGPFASPWVGFDNFAYLFQSEAFLRVFRNSVLISVYRLGFAFPVPILMAIMLSEVRNMAFKRAVQTIVYLPHFISWVVLAGILQNLLSPSTGAVNLVLKAMGADAIAFLQEPKLFRSVLVVSDIWKEAGWGTIIYLAAITGIDTQLYEAAIIDGANRLQHILYVTIPGIASTIVIILILRMGYILRNGFEQIFLLYNPIVMEVADVFETYTYSVGIREGRFSFATAVGLFQSLVGFTLILATNRFAKKYGEGGLW